MGNINREDNSSYEIARRVAALEDQTDRLIRLTEDLINIQQKIFNRLENLEKQDLRKSRSEQARMNAQQGPRHD